MNTNNNSVVKPMHLELLMAHLANVDTWSCSVGNVTSRISQCMFSMRAVRAIVGRLAREISMNPCVGCFDTVSHPCVDDLHYCVGEVPKDVPSTEESFVQVSRGDPTPERAGSDYFPNSLSDVLDMNVFISDIVPRSYFFSCNSFFGYYVLASSFFSYSILTSSFLSFNVLACSFFSYYILASSFFRYNALASSFFSYNARTSSFLSFNVLASSFFRYNALASSFFSYNVLASSFFSFNVLARSTMVS
eukprot:gene4499-14658_t